MNNEELKEALLNRRPVVADITLLGKIEFAYVSGIIYRRTPEGEIGISAEVRDKYVNSVTAIDPKLLSYLE